MHAFFPVLGISTSDESVRLSVLLISLLVGGALGWVLDWSISRFNSTRYFITSWVIVALMLAVQVGAVYFYASGQLSLSRILALGGFLSFIGSKLLILAIFPLAKAVPAGFGGGVGLYLWNRIAGRGEGHRGDKPQDTGKE